MAVLPPEQEARSILLAGLEKHLLPAVALIGQPVKAVQPELEEQSQSYPEQEALSRAIPEH